MTLVELPYFTSVGFIAVTFRCPSDLIIYSSDFQPVSVAHCCAMDSPQVCYGNLGIDMNRKIGGFEQSTVPCQRKACLKLLKYLLELLKTKHKNQFDKFCSYHAKTALFQACVKWPHDTEWLETDLEDCFERFLDFFLDCLRNAELTHFFIPEFNFFNEDRIETVKCKALAKAIESERNNRFPIFSLEP